MRDTTCATMAWPSAVSINCAGAMPDRAGSGGSSQPATHRAASNPLASPDCSTSARTWPMSLLMPSTREDSSADSGLSRLVLALTGRPRQAQCRQQFVFRHMHALGDLLDDGGGHSVLDHPDLRQWIGLEDEQKL